MNQSINDIYQLIEKKSRGFAVSSFCVGGLVGGITGSAVQTRIGRKKAIIVNTLGWILGSIIMGLSVHEAMFIVGRLITGLSCGLGSLCIPTYIGEISTIRARGAMGTCHQYARTCAPGEPGELMVLLFYRFFIVIGILLASVIGLPTATVPLWRLNYAIVGIPAAVQFFLASTCVDSPRWLVSVNHIDEARDALQKLRGGKHADIEQEFYEIIESQMGPAAAASVMRHPETADVTELKKSLTTRTTASRQQQPRMRAASPEEGGGSTDEEETLHPGNSDKSVVAPSSDEHMQESLSLIGIFLDPLIRRITIVVLSLHFIQQWIGMNAVIFYSTQIFSSAFNEDMSKYMAIATTGVNFVCTLASVVLIDHMGRRPLLLLAELGCVVFSVLLVIGYRFYIPALLVVSVFLYVASFAIGIGPIPWVSNRSNSPASIPWLIVRSF